MARLMCSQQSPHLTQTSSSESSALSVTQAPNYLPILLLVPGVSQMWQVHCSYNKGHVPFRLPHTLSHSEECLSHCGQQELEMSSGLREDMMEQGVGFLDTFCLLEL